MEKLTDKQIEKLWKKFGDVPINENDEIDINFHIWEKGVDKIEIWHWFDEQHSLGLAKGLMKIEQNK